MPDPSATGVFRFLPLERVIFGAGSLRSLPGELDRRGLQRALIITGNSIAQHTDLLWHAEQLLGPRHAASYSGARQHVPSATIKEAADLGREAAIDCVVSLGGGSPIDTAKAVAYHLAFGEATARDLGKRFDGGTDGPPPPPHFAVPTTLSAGEFTHTAGITDEQRHVKGGVSDRRLTPVVVLLDPEVTLPTPERLWLSTGIKALDHAVERLLSDRHQPVTDLLCLEAVRLLATRLPRTKADPTDLAARADCQLAAWLSMFGATSVPTGLSHALGHQIGARRDVPHGITSCITLPHVVRLIGAGVPEQAAALLRAFGEAAPAGGEAASRAAAAIARLVADLGLPSRLRDAGVSEDDAAAIAGAAFHEATARPRPGAPATIEELEGLLRAMW